MNTYQPCVCRSAEVQAFLEQKMLAPKLEESLQLINPQSFVVFMEWRADELKKLTLVTPTDNSSHNGFFEKLLARLGRSAPLPPKQTRCSCLSNQSWASGVHGICFHVCKLHAKQFGIFDGPYWEDQVAALQSAAKITK